MIDSTEKEIEHNIDNPMVVIYADDNTPSCNAENLEDLEKKTEEIAEKAVNWFIRNEMIVSSEKTKVLLMGSHRNRASKIPANHKAKIEINKEKVDTSKSEKLLGIVIDETYSWYPHLYGDSENMGLIRTLSQRVGILTKLRKFTKPKQFVPLLNGIFMSRLLYGITAWGCVSGIPGCPNDYRSGFTKQDLLRIQALQNKALRLINWSDSSLSTKSLLQQSNMLSVNQLIAYHILVQSYNIKISQKPDYHFQRLFKCDKKAIRSKDINRVEFRLNVGRSSYFYQASRLWIALPMKVKECSSLGGFKSLLKKWIIETIPIKPV